MFSFINKRKSKKNLIGVEVTEDYIAVAQVSYEIGQMPRLLLCESSAIDSSTQSQSQQACKAYNNIIKNIKNKSFSVNSVLNQSDRQLLLIEAPQVESSELREAAKWKVKDLLNFNISESIIDVIEIPNVQELKRSPMIYAVVVKRENISNIIEISKSIGFDISVIDIPDMSQRNIAALLPEDHNGVAILSINSNNSLLTITRQGHLYLSRELETGFESLMSNIQNRNSGSEIDGELSELVIESHSIDSIEMLKSLERMVLEVQRSLDYYESQYNQPQINTLAIAPLAHDIPEIKDYFSSQLGLKTKMLDFNRLFATKSPIDFQCQADTFYAVGASLR